jgi:hypothetical protein
MKNPEYINGELKVNSASMGRILMTGLSDNTG